MVEEKERLKYFKLINKYIAVLFIEYFLFYTNSGLLYLPLQ